MPNARDANARYHHAIRRSPTVACTRSGPDESHWCDAARSETPCRRKCRKKNQTTVVPNELKTRGPYPREQPARQGALRVRCVSCRRRHKERALFILGLLAKYEPLSKTDNGLTVAGRGRETHRRRIHQTTYRQEGRGHRPWRSRSLEGSWRAETPAPTGRPGATRRGRPRWPCACAGSRG